MNDQSHRPVIAHTAPKWRAGWMAKLAGSRKFQKFAARVPLLSTIARREGEAMFDLVAGFAHSQVLFAIVELRILHRLAEGAQTIAAVSDAANVPADRMFILLRAAAALNLVKLRGDRVKLGQRGAAVLGVPGLEQMIRHHAVFYRDLSDPVAFFRGDTETELAHFWPYVFGAGGATDPTVTQTYSDLMADSQTLVAEDTLRIVGFSKTTRLMDVGGGTGAFLTAVGLQHKSLDLHLFDLPAVSPGAESRFRAAGLSDRTTIHTGSFRDDPLPLGADTISLVRVLYDHSDETVRGLLSKIYDSLPKNGRIIVSEPMAGCRAGDVYFALYTLAMRTGRARSQSEICELLQSVGFSNIQTPGPKRAFVTSVITARKI